MRSRKRSRLLLFDFSTGGALNPGPRTAACGAIILYALGVIVIFFVVFTVIIIVVVVVVPAA